MSRETLTSTTAALLLALATLHCAEPQPTWTTSSPAAREEFLKGLEAERKNYATEAMQHFQRAIQLDPAFAMPKAMLLPFPISPEQKQELAAELKEVDLSTLQPQERFPVQYRQIGLEDDEDKINQFLDEQLQERPNDPFVLEAKAFRCYQMEMPKQAEALYLRLIEVEPNWAMAHNHLGYIAMEEGDFATAEKRFRTYQFIAPDQANPHDSMAELLVLIGRYDEARGELETALRLRPDFAPSLVQLIQMSLQDADLPGAEAALERLDALHREYSWPGTDVATQSCRVETWRGFLTGDWESVWKLFAEQCPQHPGADGLWMLYQAALVTGRRQEADQLLAGAEEELQAKWKTMGSASDRNWRQAIVEHLHGLESAADGDLPAAVEYLRAADRTLTYHNGVTGLLKLLNLLTLARAQETNGEKQQAAATLKEVERVNPRMLKLYDRITLPLAHQQ